ncbi:MAG: tyrosine-type recombinase/integrase [Desulfobaccales bacterium]
MTPLISSPDYGFYFCMAGRIRTKQQCPKCGGKFEGEPLRCNTCLTIPTRYFLDVPWKGDRLKIYTGKDGHPLAHWEGAQRLLEAIRHEIDQEKFDPKEYQARELKSLRFDNYALAWLERREKELRRALISVGYFTEVRAYIHRYFIPFFNRKSIRDIREAYVEDFRDSLPEHLSHKTIFNIMGVLRKLFRDAYRRKDILILPEFPKIPKGEPVTHWIDEEAQELVLAQMQDPIRRTFYLFLMKQGCRPGEARALRWGNLDLKNGIVTICAGFDRETFKPYTKERDVRPLPLHPQVGEALANLPRNLAGWVFTFRGQPITQWMASAYWRRAALKAGVKVSCYEGTRHSLASQAINRGCPDGKISKMLGHKSSASTKRYAKLLTSSLKEVWGSSPADRPQTVPQGVGAKTNILEFKDKK